MKQRNVVEKQLIQALNRYGSVCTRPDCKFWHPESVVTDSDDVDVGEKLSRLNMSWVPHTLNLALLQNGKVASVAEVDQGEVKEAESERKTYHLYVRVDVFRPWVIPVRGFAHFVSDFDSVKNFTLSQVCRLLRYHGSYLGLAPQRGFGH